MRQNPFLLILFIPVIICIFECRTALSNSKEPQWHSFSLSLNEENEINFKNTTLKIKLNPKYKEDYLKCIYEIG